MLTASQVNGVNTGAAEHSWLAPRPPPKSETETTPNIVYIRLPHAVAISKLRIWNYAKNPERGACEIEILLDDSLIYKGFVAQATAKHDDYQCIMFTNAEDEVANEKGHVKYNLGLMERDHLTLVNERVVKNEGFGFHSKGEVQARPQTAVVF